MVGKFGFGRMLRNFFFDRFGLFNRVSEVLIILLGLCGGIFVVMFMVILLVLLIRRFGKWVGRMVGFWCLVE